MQRFLRNLGLLTTDGRTTDACAMTVHVALLTKSSRAKKAELKTHEKNSVKTKVVPEAQDGLSRVLFIWA